MAEVTVTLNPIVEIEDDEAGISDARLGFCGNARVARCSYCRFYTLLFLQQWPLFPPIDF